MHVAFLQIEPTTRCNYSCGFCAGRHLPQGDLAAEHLARLLEGITGLEHVELQGEGEPLLHEGFFELIGLLRQRFPKVGISTITNGSLFTDANIERLLDHGLTRINVSMETADAERFRAIRGGKFERVERGIAAFMQRREARGLRLPAVGLAVTVLRDTATDAVDTVLPFYRRLGLDGGVTIQPLQRMPQYVRFYSRSMREQLPGPEQAQRLNQRVAASPDMAAALRERGAQPGFYERLYGSAAGRAVCPWLESGLFLGHDGALTSCCFIKDSQHFALAKAGEPLADAEQRRRRLADELRQGRIPLACQGCPTAHGVAGAAVR
ncbi:MAG: radical SAM protein [Burkholderiaceae bacterium]|nr:radical SAM protein [Burkholderiaceae bacterium]